MKSLRAFNDLFKGIYEIVQELKGKIRKISDP